MSTNDQIQYKRKFPRRRLKKQVGCLADGVYSIGQCLEIGEGGFSFAFKTLFEIEKNIVVNFQIPGGSFVSVRAQVRSVDPIKRGNLYILGCSFENLDFDRKREIRSFVSARTEAGH